MAYLGNDPSLDVSVQKYEYTATASQTTFNCTYDTPVDADGMPTGNATIVDWPIKG